MKTKLVHYLSSVHFVSQPIHVSSISIPAWPTDSQLKKHNMNQLLYIYSTPPDDGLQICPKHVGVD